MYVDMCVYVCVCVCMCLYVCVRVFECIDFAEVFEQLGAEPQVAHQPVSMGSIPAFTRLFSSAEVAVSRLLVC